LIICESLKTEETEEIEEDKSEDYMRKYSKIGILGGSFNPIHIGHTAVAQMAAEELGLDLVLFIPARVNPLKQITTKTTPLQRCSMIKEAISDNKLFELWKKELTMPTPSYTINTIEELFKEFEADEWYFIIGSDNLPMFTKWHRWAELIQKVKIAVCKRPGFPMDLPEILPKDRIVIFEGPNWGVSSSTIRKYLNENKECKYLINKKVLAYINKNNLYKEN